MDPYRWVLPRRIKAWTYQYVTYKNGSYSYEKKRDFLLSQNALTTLF
jgi:hypothetical protein